MILTFLYHNFRKFWLDLFFLDQWFVPLGMDYLGLLSNNTLVEIYFFSEQTIAGMVVEKKLDKLHEKIHFRSCCRNLRLHFSYPGEVKGKKKHAIHWIYSTTVVCEYVCISLSRYFNLCKTIHTTRLPKWFTVSLNEDIHFWNELKKRGPNPCLWEHR